MAMDPIGHPPTSAPLKKADFSAEKNAEDRRLKKACADFEGIMIQYMYKSMQSTVGDGGVFGGSFQGQMYQSMFIQKVSTALAEKRGLGLADQLYKQEQRSQENAASTPGKGDQGQVDSKEIKGFNRYRKYGIITP